MHYKWPLIRPSRYNFSTYLEARSQDRDPNLDDDDDDNRFVSPGSGLSTFMYSGGFKANLGGQRWRRIERDDEMSKAKAITFRESHIERKLASGHRKVNHFDSISLFDESNFFLPTQYIVLFNPIFVDNTNHILIFSRFRDQD